MERKGELSLFFLIKIVYYFVKMFYVWLVFYVYKDV